MRNLFVVQMATIGILALVPPCAAKLSRSTSFPLFTYSKWVNLSTQPQLHRPTARPFFTTPTRTPTVLHQSNPSLPSRNEISRAFKDYRPFLPFLYAPAGPESAALSRLEHVVPRSVLVRHGLAAAVNDPHNIHASMGPINHARENFPFSFAQCTLAPDDAIELMRRCKHLGFSNFVDTKNRVFYPRAVDCPLIARTLLRMSEKWHVPLSSVTVSPLKDVFYASVLSPPSTTEKIHWTVAEMLIKRKRETRIF
jgi:hypothetical protein